MWQTLLNESGHWLAGACRAGWGRLANDEVDRILGRQQCWRAVRMMRLRLDQHRALRLAERRLASVQRSLQRSMAG